MSTIGSVRLARQQERDGSAHAPRAWVIACIVVAGVALVLALAQSGVLPSCAADDFGSILFGAG